MSSINLNQVEDKLNKEPNQKPKSIDRSVDLYTPAVSLDASTNTITSKLVKHEFDKDLSQKPDYLEKSVGLYVSSIFKIVIFTIINSLNSKYYWNVANIAVALSINFFNDRLDFYLNRVDRSILIYS